MNNQRFLIITGGTCGDETKGATTDFFCRDITQEKVEKTGTYPFYSGGNNVVVVRYNGGPQAGHFVEPELGSWHCFAQLGSGSFLSGVKTFLSQHMLVELEMLAKEAAVFREKSGEVNPFRRIFLSAEAQIITPMHKMRNQMKEIARGANRHGSCGQGVGETAFDRRDGLGITVNDALDRSLLADKLESLRERSLREVLPLLEKSNYLFLKETFDYFQKRCNVAELTAIYQQFLKESGVNIVFGNYLKGLIDQGKSFVFEGAQGALLDPTYGFSPYITKTPTTSHNALALLAECGEFGAERVCALRAYHHRHGNGPFVTEDQILENYFQDAHNKDSRWEGPFRLGWFDLLAVRYGLLMNQESDFIALSCLDQLSGLAEIKVCAGYNYEGELDVLDKYCVWRSTGRRTAKISALKLPAGPMVAGEFAKVLFSCRPGKWRIFPGWKTDISQARSWDDLPPRAKNYVSFLASPEGLNTPIKLIGVGPSWKNRFYI